MRRRLAVSFLIAASAFAAMPAGARAQPYNSFPSKGTTERHPTGRGQFPSWERDVGAAEMDPLPLAATGKHVSAFAVEIGHAPVGVVAMLDGSVVVAAADGAVQWRDESGALLAEASLGRAVAWPPVSDGRRVVLAGPDFVALVAREGVTWTAEMARPLVGPPLIASGRVVAASGEDVFALDLATGERAWTTPVVHAATAPVATRSGLLVGTSDGHVVALDEGGRETWRVPVAERVFGLCADADAAYVAGFGRSRRAKADRGPLALRLDLAGGGARPGKVRWVLRLGAPCHAPPQLLDRLVAFASGDGYVHAVERGRGIYGWRTDLPARGRHAPAWVGGRLDFALAPSPYLVALAAENGAVMGYTALEDEDDYFVGPAASLGAVTVAATRLERLLGFRWETDEKRKPSEDEPISRAPQVDATRVGDDWR